MQWQPGQSRRRKRRIRYGRLRWDRLLIVLVGLVVLVFGLVKLIGYGLDLLSSRHTSDQLQIIYYSTSTGELIPHTPEPAIIPASALPSAPMPVETAALAPSSAPTLSPVPRLESKAYPQNPKLQINSRFKTLRKESKDIVGWLSISRMLDEAVVQRDNVYYLDHDALGKSNVNGALFLDAAIGLKTRPYTYIIYGHNMKSGAMFGGLRNYENSTFYHNYPFIAFDTLYESGQYVIFAVGTISTEQYGRNYVDFFFLQSTRVHERQTAIDALMAASVHTCPVDVQADDQLLVLVTCVEKDEDRRVVAARRIRDDEDEAALKKLVEKSRKR